MKVVSNKALIYITTQEEKAIEEVAALLDTIHKRLGDDCDLFGMMNGDDLLDTIFDNDAFNCEVDIDLQEGEE